MIAEANGSATQWREATTVDPCPICGKGDWCSLTGPQNNPEVAVCMRVESDNQRGNGGWFHRLSGSACLGAPAATLGRGKPRHSYPTKADAIAALERSVGRPHSRHWVYRDAEQQMIGAVVRWDATDSLEKSIRPLSVEGDRWTVGAMPSPRPLLHLPNVLLADEVFVVEGERCVDEAISIELAATTWAGGCKAIDKTNWQPLAGKRVTIWPDKDEPGLAATEKIAAKLIALDPPAEVRIVEPPEWLPLGGDLADFMEQHDAVEPDALAELVMAQAATVHESATPTSSIEVVSVTRSLTDVGNAERFAAEHGAQVRHVHNWRKWLCWNGSRWQIDDSGETVRLAKATARAIYAEAALTDDEDKQKAIAKWAKASQSAFRLRAMIDLARSEQPIPISHESLDVDPYQLNCTNGTVDLRTGELRPHDRGDLLSKTTGIEYPNEPEAAPILWLEFLDEVFGGDVKLIGFIQRLCGLALIGDVLEHILPILYGTGSNGKTVFVETWMAALGEYAETAAHGLLIKTHGDRHPTELADLYRKRLVALVESDENSRLNEALIKRITGGDKIKGRRMREDFWQFDPSHLCVMVTNHKPIVRGTDNGIWRRLRLIPFTVTIPDERQDKQLPGKLRGELPAILRWMVQGTVDYGRHGLMAPESVMAATQDYRHESDTFATWFDECMVVDPAARTKASVVWSSYTAWAEDIKERPIGRKTFGQRMEEKIIERQTSNGTWYVGVKFPEE